MTSEVKVNLVKYGIEVLKLPNGLTVYLKKMDTNRAYITVFVQCGSLYETKRNCGISHLLEHLIGEDGLIKERRARPVYKIERVGGELDFETSQDYTAFHLETWFSCWRRSLKLLLKMIAEPRFSEANLEREKQVVINEQQNERDEFSAAVDRLLFRNHPLSLPPEGTRAVSLFTSRRVKSWHKKFYQPKRAELVVVGKITMKQLVAFLMRNGCGLLNSDEGIIEAPLHAEIKWGKEYELKDLNINRSAFIYPLPLKPVDLAIVDHILNMMSDISSLGAQWDVLRPLELHEGFSIGTIISVCCGYTSLVLSASSQKTLAKLEKRMGGWLQKVLDKGIPVDFFSRIYRQAASRVVDNCYDPHWWWESIRNMVNERALEAIDQYLLQVPREPNEVKKEMERVFKNIFGHEKVIIRSFVKKHK